GIPSTPVVDPGTKTLYVEAKTKETVGTGCSTTSPCWVQRLHALDLVTGAEKLGGPVVIAAPNFSSLHHMQRPALRLANGSVYVAFGAHGDRPTYQGWLFAYDAATLVKRFAVPVTNVSSNTMGGVGQ